MCGRRAQRGVSRDFLGRLPHNLLVGGNEACFDRGLRLGTALKDAAFYEQPVGALTSSAHELNSGTMFHSRPLPALAANICNGQRDVCLRRSSMARKYSRGASRYVERAMKKRKRGSLRSGRSGKKVKSRKQAIAIGLSEARRKGKRVPPRKSSKKRKSSRKRKLSR